MDKYDPVADTVEAIVTMHVRSEQKAGRHQRFVESSTATIGRPAFLYSILSLIVIWITINSIGSEMNAHPVDPPPFFWLQGFITLLAFLTATVVLITQNRQGRLAERRSQLDMQINLISEQKISKVIDLLEELRRDLPNVKNRSDPTVDTLKEVVDPGAVLLALEERLESDALQVNDDVETNESEHANDLRTGEDAASAPVREAT